MRKLATIQKIIRLEPISGADRIELASVLGWKCIVGKGEYNVGDPVVYFEVDSLLPETPDFEFLRARCFVDNDMNRGFRIKTMKMKGVLSQGLIMPISLLAGAPFDVGDDVTVPLGVRKYETEEKDQVVDDDSTWTPKFNFGKKFFYKYLRPYIRKVETGGKWPSKIPHTDEIRIQSDPSLIEVVNSGNVCVTEKVDGSSATYAILDGVFYACSRNIVKLNIPISFWSRNVRKITGWFVKPFTQDWNSTWGSFARALDMMNRMVGARKVLGVDNLIVQGELVGPGIQKNRLKLSNVKFYVFSVILPDAHGGRYLDYQVMVNLFDCSDGLPSGVSRIRVVPERRFGDLKNVTVDSLISAVDGLESVVTPGVMAKGVVIRPRGGFSSSIKNTVSVKVINNSYLLQEK